ncbi:MAG TPA: SAM-dependent methyltransferase [Chloroflexi bacterium]|nr:SAM-dependent methyltransferase [Chloroflexota bacterium]
MLPPEFLTRMQAQLGPEYAEFLASYEQTPDVGLRVNTLKLMPGQFVALASNRLTPDAFSPIPWCPAGFVVSSDERLGKHPYHAAGLYYLQDPAAQAVAELAAPQPGERVLDLSAAPGGKTTHLASLMQNEGLLVANDVHPKRVRDLAKNIERWGAHNVAITNALPPQLVAHFGAFFDRVLVDAPCSGEGMFRKDPAARGEWLPKLVESCALRQNAILDDAAQLVRPGGFLIYSTCTFAPAEDESTLSRFLEDHADFEMCAVPKFPGFEPGRPDWLSDVDPALGLERAVRLWPHKAVGEGHFIAVLRRTGDALARPGSAKIFQPGNLPAEVQRDLAAFTESTLGWQPPQNRLALLGSYLYLVPEGLPDLRGLSVIHWGWWLGTSKKNRFEPSHALAMGLRAEDVRQTLPLRSADPALERYLRGEVLPALGPDGWVLVTVDGFPLGWGKRVQGRLKSHLPSWLRRM